MSRPPRHEPQHAAIRRRLAAERGRIDVRRGFSVVLAYPSPYHTGMSSLGFQQIYRVIQGSDVASAERAFLPDDEGKPGSSRASDPVLTYESQRPISHFPVIAVSVAYELELAGLSRLLERSGIPPLREERGPEHPLIVAGGPLTFSNPLPLGAFADAIVMGEADALVLDVLRVLEGSPPREEALRALAGLPHVHVPALHGEELPAVCKADDALLPAWAPIRTDETELSGMFLIEAERGCSRGCSYCVMRRSTNGGMRTVPMERILSLVPEDAQRVGLVGAAVSDHPRIAEIVRALVGRGAEVGLSSLRPDRLTDELVGALRAGGYKTLTTAMDGTSERVRELLDRKARVRHLQRAAELARAHGMNRLKLYLMVGVPTEEDADVDECVGLVTELSRTIPVALGIAPFCPKRNTPLAGGAFAGIDVVERRLERLRRGLRGRADVRATSARWAWVEAVLAQGGVAEGRAVLEAVREGGSFAAWRRAFERLPPRERAPFAAPAPGRTFGARKIRKLPLAGGVAS